ncbi:MAG: hypothetical protein WC615_04865 [Mucilaginibacter sp.]|uniref:hypothetical protein n=1 Tax=Mucilaginibacter sp. TaxID=1882438 RepID=UPI00356335CC
MKQRTINDSRTLPYNKAVKAAYYKILRGAKNLIATVDRHDLRCTINLTAKPIGGGEKEQQLISPILYLALDQDDDGEHLCIQFGFEQFSERNVYTDITAKFVRMIYNVTAKANNEVNIEDCLYTAAVITDCSELYEAIESSHMNYPIAVIPYKPAAVKRKQMRAVA